MTKTILGFLAAAIALVFYLSFFVVDEREKALVLRFGDINHVVDEPGIYFKVPIADTVTMVEDRIIIWEYDNLKVQDVASQFYVVDATALARIDNAGLFRESLSADLNQASDRVGALLDAALRQTYGRRSFDQVLSSDRSTMMQEIATQVRGEAKSLGIDIVDVRVRRTDLDGSVLVATYERMRSERVAVATDIRSKGEATKVRKNAETDRTYAERTSNARRDAEIIRGQADAERNKVFAEAYSQDPEFFSFYRSMQAYARSLAGDGTTMVLDPKSEFFKHFGAQGKQAVPAPAQ